MVEDCPEGPDSGRADPLPFRQVPGWGRKVGEVRTVCSCAGFTVFRRAVPGRLDGLFYHLPLHHQVEGLRGIAHDMHGTGSGFGFRQGSVSEPHRLPRILGDRGDGGLAHLAVRNLAGFGNVPEHRGVSPFALAGVPRGLLRINHRGINVEGHLVPVLRPAFRRRRLTSSRHPLTACGCRPCAASCLA